MIKPARCNYIFIFLLLLLVGGCAPAIKREVSEPRPEIKTAPVLSPDIIDKKISALEELLKNDRLPEKERSVANELLSDYRLARSFLKEDMEPSDHRELVRILFRNLDRLDKTYLINRGGLKECLPVDIIHEYYQERRKIMETYLSGNYRKVIQQCIDLESSFGPDALTAEIGLLFAESLAENGMLEEAIRIGENIIRELEGRPGMIHIRAGLVRWQLALGHRENAARVYEKLVDNLDEEKILLEDIQKRMAEAGREGPVHDAGPPEVDKKVVFRESDTLEDILDKVDTLLQRQSFNRARLLLIKWRLRHEEGPDTERVESALKKVETAEERFRKEQLSEKEALAKAVKLIEEEKFEEAISELDYWIDSGSTNRDMKKIKDLAVDKLILRERNRAARIFLKAKNTIDPDRKKELLLSSLNILKKLIEKYPSSTLINKLNDHIIRVNEELEKTRGSSG